jgi:hypothetical protein
VVEGRAAVEVREDVAGPADADVRKVRLHLEAFLVAVHDLAREDTHRSGEERKQRLAGAARLRVELVALELHLGFRPERDARAVDHDELHVAIGARAEHVPLANLREDLQRRARPGALDIRFALHEMHAADVLRERKGRGEEPQDHEEPHRNSHLSMTPPSALRKLYSSMLDLL